MNDMQYNSLMTSMGKLVAKQNEIVQVLNNMVDLLTQLSKKTLIVDQSTQDLYRLKIQVQSLIDEASA